MDVISLRLAENVLFYLKNLLLKNCKKVKNVVQSKNEGLKLFDWWSDFYQIKTFVISSKLLFLLLFSTFHFEASKNPIFALEFT